MNSFLESVDPKPVGKIQKAIMDLAKKFSERGRDSYNLSSVPWDIFPWDFGDSMKSALALEKKGLISINHGQGMEISLPKKRESIMKMSTIIENIESLTEERILKGALDRSGISVGRDAFVWLLEALSDELAGIRKEYGLDRFQYKELDKALSKLVKLLPDGEVSFEPVGDKFDMLVVGNNGRTKYRFKNLTKADSDDGEEIDGWKYWPKGLKKRTWSYLVNLDEQLWASNGSIVLSAKGDGHKVIPEGTGIYNFNGKWKELEDVTVKSFDHLFSESSFGDWIDIDDSKSIATALKQASSGGDVVFEIDADKFSLFINDEEVVSVNLKRSGKYKRISIPTDNAKLIFGSRGRVRMGFNDGSSPGAIYLMTGNGDMVSYANYL